MDNEPRQTGPPYLEALLDRGPEVNPYFGLMGIRLIRVEPGTAILEMSIRPDMHNGQGWLQGGVLVSLGDEAMALALYTALLEGEQIATIAESSSFLKGVREGTLFATGRLVKRGRRVAFTEAEVRIDSLAGEVVSRHTASFTILKP